MITFNIYFKIKEYMKVTEEEFIKRSNSKHSFKYDYSKCNFTKTNDKVTIICREHGEFEQRANAHYTGQGCPTCNRTIPLSERFERFLKKSKEIHNDKYDYSLVSYTSVNDRIKIICNLHGVFTQKAGSHISGHGCKKCGKSNAMLECWRNGKRASKKTTFNKWIERCNSKHNFKYDYSLIDSIESDRKTKYPIRCENGHIFFMTIHDHLSSGNGCKFCSKACYDTESFIRLSNEKHGNKYDYSKTIYKNQKEKVIITCPRHGDFFQKAANHYHLGRGCGKCGESKGEMEIRKWLESNNKRFEKEKTFQDCLNLSRLRFDFYLPDYKTCIEFDGAQHFKVIEQFGGVDEFERVKERDRVKNQYCKENNIILIRINFRDLKKGIVGEKLAENIQT